jgi:small subunit ribosomal protein S9
MKKKNNKIKKVVKKRSSKVSAVAKKAKPQDRILTYPSGKYIEGIGGRKVATARVRIYEAKGDFIVNDKLVSDYFANVTNAPKLYNKPFNITETIGKFSVTARVGGSGVQSQLDAVVHGLTRALIKFKPELKPLLKEAGLTTRDDRMKETRKVGMGGKARRKRQSPKR